MKKYLILLLMIFGASNLQAQLRTLMLDTSDTIYAPTNFFNTNFLSPNTLYVSKSGNDDAARVGTIKAWSSFTRALSNVVNNSTVIVYPGRYSNDTWAYSSNVYNSRSQLIVPNHLMNKSDVVIQGVGMPTIYTGNTPFGETMMLSNCQRITIRGIRFESLRVTNTASMPHAFNYNWAGFKYMNCNELLFEGCEFVNHHNQGLQDGGNSTASGASATTNLVISRCVAKNIGSYFPAVTISGIIHPASQIASWDGAAISPTGGIVEDCKVYESGTSIEPYTADYPGLTTIIRNNYIENSLLHGIQDGSSGPYYNVMEIVGNTIVQFPGYTRNGTNFVAISAIAAGIYSTATNGLSIRNNTIKNYAGAGINWALNSPAKGGQIIGNYIHSATNENASGVAANTSYGIYVQAFTYKVDYAIIANNVIRKVGHTGMELLGLRNSQVTDNLVMDANWQGAGSALIYLYGCSNVTVSGNNLYGIESTPRNGIYVEAGNQNLTIFNNDIKGNLSNGTIEQTSATNEVTITVPFKRTYATLTTNTYINTIDDTTVILGVNGAGIHKTNKLHYPYPGLRLTIRDGVGTCNGSSSNIVFSSLSGAIRTNANRTSITNPFGSAVFEADGTNWFPVSWSQ